MISKVKIVERVNKEYEDIEGSNFKNITEVMNRDCPSVIFLNEIGCKGEDMSCKGCWNYARKIKNGIK